MAAHLVKRVSPCAGPRVQAPGPHVQEESFMSGTAGRFCLGQEWLVLSWTEASGERLSPGQSGPRSPYPPSCSLSWALPASALPCC